MDEADEMSRSVAARILSPLLLGARLDSGSAAALWRARGRRANLGWVLEDVLGW
jgi:hypothetical protein